MVTSTAEAEYISLSDGSKMLIWMMNLLKEMGVDYSKPIIYVDNQAAINIARDRASSKRSKHIDVKYHHVRELFESELVDIQYVNTNEMLADCFTKILTGSKFVESRQKILKSD